MWQARFGSVGCIWAWFGAVRFGRCGVFRLDGVWRGELRQARYGHIWTGEISFGQAGKLIKEKL